MPGGHRGPRQGTVVAHLARIGEANESKDLREPAYALAEWAKKHHADAKHLWSLVQNNQVRALSGETELGNLDRAIYKDTCR